MRNTKKAKIFYKKRKKQRLERNKYIINEIDMSKQTYLHKKHNSQQCCFRNIKGSNGRNTKNEYSTPVTLNNNSYSSSLKLWWQTYCSAINYFQKQQQLWRLHQQEQNHHWTMLLKSNEQDLLEKYAKEYETSSSEEDNEEEKREMVQDEYHNHNNYDKSEEESIDEEYLQFLEITYKHREELRLRREKESLENS